MAVAVASLPQGTQVARVHAQTAQDALLDALLSSCEKPSNPPLKSFGRDLKPYFPVADYGAKQIISTQKKGTRTRPTPPPVAAAAAAAAASTKQTCPIARGNNAKSTGGPKKAMPNKTKAPLPKKEVAVTTTTAASLSKPLPPFNNGDMAAFLSWAGPGFCVAPSPDKLPLPTTLLLD